MNSKQFHVRYHPFTPDQLVRVTVFDYRRHIHPKPREYHPTQASLNRLERLTYQLGAQTRAYLTIAGGYDIFIHMKRSREV